MGEAGAVGNFFEGEVGLGEELFHALELDADDFLVGGAANEFDEAFFHEAAGLGNGLDDVLDVDAVAGVVADVMEGAGDVAVVNGEDIGGLAGGDAEGGDEVGFAFEFAAGDHFGEERGGFVAGAVGVGDDAGKGRAGEFAEEFVVVDADDGDFIGDSDADAAAGIEDLLATKIVAGHDADGLGKLADPFGELVGFLVPSPARFARSGINRAGVAGSANGINEMFFAPFGPVEAIVAGVGEVDETAFEKMFGGEMGDGAVVGFEPGKRGNEASGADIDDGHVQVAESFGDGGIFDPGDDTAAIPGGEPTRGLVAAGVFGKVNGPGAMFADEADDAAEQTASVGVGGFDEKGDFGGGFQCILMARARSR